MLVIRDLAKWLHGARSKMRQNHGKNFHGPNHRSMVPEPDHFARVRGRFAFVSVEGAICRPHAYVLLSAFNNFKQQRRSMQGKS